MTELRSIQGSNRWHIVQDNVPVCHNPHLTSFISITITDKEFTQAASTNRIHTPRPGKLCQRCLKTHRPDLYHHIPIKPGSTLTPRLDLDEHIVEQARLAVAIQLNVRPESIPFSKLAAIAINTKCPLVCEQLTQAGFQKSHNIKRGRPRRISQTFWNHLEEMAKGFDTSRIAILRAAIQLLATELILTPPPNLPQ